MAMTATITLLGTPIQARAAEEDFDPVFYAETYPDVVAVVGTDAEALYNHYINNGKAEGRLPHATTADAPTTQTKAGSKWEEIEPYLENAPTVDMNDPGSERLREMLKDIPMDDELREVVIRIGDGAKWDFDTRYDYKGAGHSDACQAYTDLMESLVYGNETYEYGNRELTPNPKTDGIKIQQYDTIVVRWLCSFISHITENILSRNSLYSSAFFLERVAMK